MSADPRPTRAQLQALADDAERRAADANWCSPVDALKAAAQPAPPPTAKAGEAFGAWLRRQVGHRNQMIARLAKVAASDPRWPKGGDVEVVRVYLGQQGADGDMHAALDDAELDWLCI